MTDKGFWQLYGKCVFVITWSCLEWAFFRVCLFLIKLFFTCWGACAGGDKEIGRKSQLQLSFLSTL